MTVFDRQICNVQRAASKLSMTKETGQRTAPEERCARAVKEQPRHQRFFLRVFSRLFALFLTFHLTSLTCTSQVNISTMDLAVPDVWNLSVKLGDVCSAPFARETRLSWAYNSSPKVYVQYSQLIQSKLTITWKISVDFQSPNSMVACVCVYGWCKDLIRNQRCQRTFSPIRVSQIP